MRPVLNAATIGVNRRRSAVELGIRSPWWRAVEFEWRGIIRTVGFETLQKREAFKIGIRLYFAAKSNSLQDSQSLFL